MIKIILRITFILHTLLKARIDIILKEYGIHSKIVSFIIFLTPYQFIKSSRSDGERLANALESAGPIFIKFGQLLSTRPDALPKSIHKGLIRLQDNLAPFDNDVARRIIENDLNKTIEEVFINFNKDPIAAASIAQIYEANLLNKDGTKEEIIIKVVRPSIEGTISIDLVIMRKLAKILEWLAPDTKRLSLLAMIEEYEFVIRSELDMRIESSNILQTSRNFVSNSALYVPKVFKEFTSKNILVMEKVSGVPVSDIKKLSELGIDLKLLSERGVEIFFKQVFVDNFFHADMHPGNIFVNTDESNNPSYIAVDYAIVGSLSEEELFQIGKILLALFNRNFLEIAQIMINSNWVDPATRSIDLERTIRAACEPIYEEPIENINFGELLLFVFKSTKKFNLTIPPSLMLLQKTLINVEGLGKQLYPKLDFWTIAKSFLKEWLAERYNPLKMKKWAEENAFEWLEKSRKIPELAEKAVTQIGMLEKYNANSEDRNYELLKTIKRGNQINLLMYALLTGILLWSLVNI